VERRVGASRSITSAWSQQPVETDWYVKGTDTPVEEKLGKMGKSLNNSVDPLDVVASYGADTLRIYEMFMGPLEQVKPWQTSGCEGVSRFLNRVWRLFVDTSGEDDAPVDEGLRPLPDETPKEVRKALHVAIQECTSGIEELKFNTPVSKMMEFVNAAKGTPPARADALDFVKILSPYAPHLAEELWERLGQQDPLAYAPWPEVDPSALVDDTVTIAVQVNGKVRATIEVAADADKDAVLAAAKGNENVVRWLEGKTLRREIVVPGRLVNLVVG
jgi:leucyl-tRNA synthetase